MPVEVVGVDLGQRPGDAYPGKPFHAPVVHERAAQDARVPELGAGGAIAAVLGAYFVLYPGSRVRTFIFPVFLDRIPAWIFLGLWFLYQLIEANFGLFNAKANGGAVAFFAHVGGFIFGLLVARLFAARAGQAEPEERWP